MSTNEMLMDPAILMTSKNPSLSQQSSQKVVQPPAPSQRARSRNAAKRNATANNNAGNTGNNTGNNAGNGNGGNRPRKEPASGQRNNSRPRNGSQSTGNGNGNGGGGGRQRNDSQPRNASSQSRNNSRPRSDSRPRTGDSGPRPRSQQTMNAGARGGPRSGAGGPLHQHQHTALVGFRPWTGGAGGPGGLMNIPGGGGYNYHQPHPNFFFNKPGMSAEYVSREMMDYYQRNRQNNDQFKGKQTLRQALETTLKNAFPKHSINLYMIGSSTNGIGDNPSSVDICIMASKEVPEASKPKEPVQEADKAAEAKLAAEPEKLGGGDDNSTVEAAIDAAIDAVTAETAANVAAKVIIEDAVEAAAESKDAATKAADTEDATAATSAVEEKPSEEGAATSAAAAAAQPEPVPELTLAMVEAVLQNKHFAKDIVSIPAKVPIIKFRDDIAKMDITLNLNQEVSVRNTQLIRDYAKVDWRFPHLAMILKQWARENRVCSAIDKTISSYSWTLMVVHYLQTVEPPVLPSLQKLMPRRYDSRTSSVKQTITNWRRYPIKWHSNNTSNLRQLLKGLFRYYGYVFRYDQYVISVREGKLLERATMPGVAAAAAAAALAAAAGSSAGAPPAVSTTGGQWSSYLAIEEPFNRSNTTRSVHDKEQFQRIIELLRMSSNALRGVRISLFNVIADDIYFPIKYAK